MILRPSTFEWRAEDVPGGAVYHLKGRLYGTREGYAFQEEIHHRAQQGLRGLVLDMAGVERIDSCGIGILAAVLVSVRNGKGVVVLASIPPLIVRLLDTVWFLQIVEHCEGVPAALDKIQS